MIETVAAIARLRDALSAPARALAIALLLGTAPAGATDDPQHPLDPLTAREYAVLLDVLAEAGHTYEDTLFPLITLAEPDKAAVLAWKPGEAASRRAFAVLRKGHRTLETVVDLVDRKLVSEKEVPEAQPGILLSEEWAVARERVRRDPRWRAAIALRGIDDPGGVIPVPMTVGFFGDPREKDGRLIKVVSYDGRESSNHWGRPIEGVVALVDLDAGEVVEVVDTGVVSMPSAASDFDREALGEPAPPASPVSLAQPGGPAFELAGQFVTWRKWSFHWRLDPRLGPVLSLVRYRDGERQRPILYQGSVSEMFVPYTDPDTSWYFRAYMDAGEYGLGRLASRLVPERDCPANAVYLHPLLADEYGNPFLQQRAVCLFERYAGETAWRHFETETGETEVRRATDLVLRTVPTLGNYDYVLDWIFREDGSVGVSVGATGVVQVKAVGESGAEPYGRRVAEGLAAIHHDHFFSFRLDLDVDGPANSLQVDRLETVELEGGPRTSTWTIAPSIARTESAAKLTIDLRRPAIWRVINAERRGEQGHPVSYQLLPGANTTSLFAPEDIVQRRAGFTDHHLWATPYRPEERYAAGLYPNQSRGGDGLPRWTSADRPIENTDIVLWYTLGMHHVVRTEDWPVMPTSRAGFELRPFDFFNRNPALDLPE